MQYQKIKYPVAIFFLLLVFPIIGSAQKRSLNETFKWDKTTKTQTIKIKVEKDADQLEMNFEGWIAEGNLLITAYDPNGDKVGGFSLVCSGEGGSHIDIEGSGDNDNDVHVHVHSDSGSSSSTTSHSKSSTSTVTVTTDNDKVKRKNRIKNKSKSKSKKGKSYTVTSTSSDYKGAKGVMKKRIDDPTAGIWEFVLEIKEVSGSLDAEVKQR